MQTYRAIIQSREWRSCTT